jgi:hypothetical protein
MNWLIIFFCIILYIHIYLHFKINPYNQLSTLNDICKQDITNTIYFKLPFMFDGSTIINDIDLSACTLQNKNKNTYIKTYNSTPMLEPYVKFFTKNEIYKLKKGKSLDIHRNLECRNFYILHKGKITITCIHPKYAEHFKTITPDTNSFIEKNENMIHMDLTEKQILFVPNYWYVYIKAEDKHTIIEKIQYSTIMNQVNILCSNII